MDVIHSNFSIVKAFSIMKTIQTKIELVFHGMLNLVSLTLVFLVLHIKPIFMSKKLTKISFLCKTKLQCEKNWIRHLCVVCTQQYFVIFCQSLQFWCLCGIKCILLKCFFKNAIHHSRSNYRVQFYQQSLNFIIT